MEFITAFLAGLTSFFAPCLIPLFPVYFSTLTGFTFADLYGLDYGRLRRRVVTTTLFFCLGFSLLFTLLGATGSLIGKLIDTYLPLLLRASGIFLIVLGLIQTGILKLPALEFDTAWRAQKKLAHLGYLTALVTGIAAALSWIPCISPLLSPILLLAAQSQTVAQGALLLFIYSLGLTTPFLLGGLFFPQFATTLQTHRTLLHRLSTIAGIVLILFGIIVVTDQYRMIIQWFYDTIGFVYAYRST